MANQIYALLVGIDCYANPAQVPNLRGCVADAVGTLHLLEHRFNVPSDNILVLTSSREGGEPLERLPTRDNILRGWREHLGQAGKGDQVFFAFSGHGSQARSVDPSEPDGYDETLVAYDSRTAGLFDILDKELAQLVREVEQRGAQVAVLLDCCHAGGGTRTSWDRPVIRRCRPDRRARPHETVLPGAISGAATRSLKAGSGWLQPGEHVLLAACRDEELSNEYRVPETGLWQGITSHFFQRALAGKRPGATWNDLYEYVLTQVNAVYPQQTPQLEGPGDRVVFGAMLRNVEGYLLVMDVDDNFIKVSGGIAVGLTPGSRLAIYPPASDLTGGATATATVEEVHVDHAWARLDAGNRAERAGRTKITAYGYPDQIHGVYSDDTLFIEQMSGKAQSPFLHVTDKESASFCVAVEHDHYVVTDRNGQRLIHWTAPYGQAGAQEMVNLLTHIAVYRNVQRLHNPAPDSRLRDTMKMEAVSYTRVGRGGQPLDPIPMRTLSGEAVTTAERIIQITIRNNAEYPVYIAVLNLDPEYRIRRIFPIRTVYQRIAPYGKATISGLQFDGITQIGTRSSELLKVFVTRTPTSFDVLQLPALGQDGPHGSVRSNDDSLLATLLDGVRNTGACSLVLNNPGAPEDWTVLDLSVTVLGVPQENRLPAGESSVSAGGELDLMVEKPVEFDGVVRIGTIGQATRSDGRMGRVALPPGLDNPEAGEHFQPVTTGEEGAPIVLEFHADADRLASITADTPIRLEITIPDEPDLEGIVPVAHDGTFFYVAGRPSAVSIGRTPDENRSKHGTRRLVADVHFLPTMPAEDAPPRDLRRTARLFLYKMFYRKLPADAGLRHAKLVDGQVESRVVEKSDLAGARRIAIFVHGFGGNGAWSVEQIWPLIEQRGNYDTCLTYEYESLGTGIRENAERLADKLHNLGCGPNDGFAIDIFAYSMGCLVSRALVEICYGHEYIDRVFMGGPPNAGTPLAQSRQLLPWVANVLVNMAGSIPPALVAHWLLDRLTGRFWGLADLEPESTFLRELNYHRRRPADVDYFVQMGDNSGSYLDWKRFASRANKLLDSSLDMLFAGDNDLVISVWSGLYLRNRWPRLRFVQLPVNHFQYFHSPEARAVLEQWLDCDDGPKMKDHEDDDSITDGR